MPKDIVNLLNKEEIKRIEDKRIELADKIISLHDELKIPTSQKEYDTIDESLREMCKTYESLGEYIEYWNNIADKISPKRPGQGFPGPQHQTEGWSSKNYSK